MTTTANAAGSPSLARIVLLVLLPFGSGYFLSYLFRAVNAVVAPDLVAEIQLSASSLGLLTSAYLFAFAAFQLPLGILLDRYGPRRVQTCLFLVGAAGAFLFASAESESLLILARAMIGLGFAGGLMGSFKAVALFAPPGRMPLLNSWVMAFGGLGVLVAATPADMAVQAFGWREVFFGLGTITIAVALLIWIIVPRRGESPSAGVQPEPLGQQLQALGRIYTDREFWRVVPLVMLCCASHIAIQTLWAGPWLADVGGLARDDVASTLSLMALAFTVGILGSGALADWTRRFGKGPLFVMMFAMALYLVSQAGLLLGPSPLMLVFWLLFGMTGQLGILAYPHLSEHFGAALAGRAGTAVNLLVFGGAFAIQYGFGAILDLWQANTDGAYPEDAYATAIGVFLVAQVVAFGWFFVGQPKRSNS